MTAKKKGARLPGHALPNEGRLSRFGGGEINGPGTVRCICGERSPLLPNTAQRKQWHRDHKDDIRAGGTGKVWGGGKP